MKTYNEWRLLGYQVRRGQRSRSRNEAGIPTFSASQVKPSRRQSAYMGLSEREYDIDEMEQWADFDNYGWGND